MNEQDKYFLKYQREAIMEEARLELWEKSIRIGATYAHAFRGVRRRQLGLGNLLHTSVNERIAKEFITECKRFCRIFDVAGASDVNEFEVFNAQENRRETAFEIQFKQQGVSIKAFSSNPDCLRGEGGEVNIDELTSHRQPEAMLAAAGGRAMWGYPIRIWTSHKGVGSCFNRLIQEERAKGDRSRWKIRTTTLLDALDMGLLEKINEVRKLSMSREDFIADTIAAVGGQEAYEEECLCKPRNSGNAAIAWNWIDAAKTDYRMMRKHIEGNERFDVLDWIGPLLAEIRAAGRAALGYDVARTGHLSAITVNLRSAQDRRWRLAALLTMKGRKFSLQREAVETILRAAPAAAGAGDKTGLGMQVCEELTESLGEARFTGINFGQMKPDLGTRMIKVFEDGRQQIPAARDDEDVAFDLHGIHKDQLPSGRAHFFETQNPVNKDSHCDIAWALALSLLVGEEAGGWGYC
jgi:phage FluMu gp28-like protein